MAIESDVMGADSRLAVQFYNRAVKNEPKSLEAGRPIFEDKIYIKIVVPGDNLSEIDRPMYNEDKQRFPKHWYDFQNRHGDDEVVTGTPLEEWALLTKGQAEELKGLKFRTVESIANCADSQLQRIGMIAGMSPHSFREKAKSFLNVAQSSADVEKREAELQALREANEQVKAEADAKLAKMQEQLETLMSLMAEKKPKAKKAKEESAE
jgi:hypothetical protein